MFRPKGVRPGFFFKTVSLALGAYFLLLLLASPKTMAQGGCGGEEFVCGEALVKFSRLLSPVQVARILELHGAQVIDQYSHLRLYYIRFSSEASTLDRVKSLEEEFGVLKATPNWIVHAQAIPDDPFYPNLWGLHNEGTPEADIDAQLGWDHGTDGSGVVVAVIDTGIDYDHPDLAANIWTNPGEIPDNGIDDDGNGFIDDVHGYDFRNNDSDPSDDHGHGTHVSGTIGAVGNNGIGVVGVNWNAKIMAIKFLGSNASGSLSDAIAGINYAVANGAMILNNSWGGGGFDDGLLSAILDSDAAGVVFCAAAGNFGNDIDDNPFYPAAYDSPNIISVASIHQGDGLSSFSNFGKLNVDLGAPGSVVFSTLPNGSYGNMSGTSMATPHVAGTAALLWSQFPDLSHRQIINLILQSVVSKLYLEDITVTGGLLNLNNSFDLANNPDNSPPVANAGSDQTVAVGDPVQLQGSATDEDGDFPLLFEWTLEGPEGTQASLDDPLSQTPSFVPDTEGEYTATLVVSDYISSSIPDSVTITVDGVNIPPPVVVIHGSGIDPETGQVVDLGSGNATEVGKPVILDGSDSEATFTYLLVYEWALIEQPLGSQLALGASQSESIQLTPDVPGTYTVRLTVEDGFNESFGDFSFVAALPEDTATAGPDDPAEDPGAAPTNPTGAQSSNGCRLTRHWTQDGSRVPLILGGLLLGLWAWRRTRLSPHI